MKGFRLVQGLVARPTRGVPDGAMLTLRVGPKYYLEGASNAVEVYRGDRREYRVEGLHHVYDPASRLLRRFGAEIQAVEVGFCDVTDVNFLEFLPAVTKIWILTSDVKDVTGLRFSKQLDSLAIERPTCRMDVLGELAGLKTLYLDDWRPGAASIFRLSNLETVRLRRYPYADLTPMSGWKDLRHLWLAYGGLQTLEGIPAGVRELELASLRKLRNIEHVRNCPDLERLIVEACASLTSLAGIEACHALKILSLFNSKSRLRTLEPLRGLASLTYLVLTQIAEVVEPDETVLDSLQRLETLIISRKIGIPEERLRQPLPQTDIRIVR